MTPVGEWWEALPGDPLGWLLDGRHPNVAWRTLVELVGRPPDSPAVRRARGGACAAEPVATLLAPLLPDGRWDVAGDAWSAGGGGWRLVAAVELGADPADPRLQAAVTVMLDRRELPPGWDRGDGVGGPCAAARALAAAAALGLARHPVAQEVAARLEELPWRCGATAGSVCRATAVAALLAAGRAPQLRRRALAGRAVEVLLGEPDAVPELPSHPNLCATDPVEETWALALAGVGPRPTLRRRLEWVQRLAGEGGRWRVAPGPPPELAGLRAPAWDAAAARFVTLPAAVALSRYAVAVGLERRFPQRPG